MPAWLETAAPYAITAILFVPAVFAATHALLYRRDTRAAVLWIGIIWLTPLVGAILYWTFGWNRLRRRARILRAGLVPVTATAGAEPVLPGGLAKRLAEPNRHLVELDRLVDRITTRPLLPGNRIEPLVNGDEAMPAMLEAIENAERSIALAVYIFDNDKVGRAFVAALGRAVDRGVEVRVLVDDTGARYSLPRIWPALRSAGIPFAAFHPRFKLRPRSTLNLRNHRKILVTDGRTGFTGGMNIRRGHVLSDPGRSPTADLHFRVAGPVVAELADVFAEDWAFTTGEKLTGETWFPAIEPAGDALARAIADGPDSHRGKLSFTIRGALQAARRTVRIVTPYFLPDDRLVSALNLASLRGVEVDVVIPERTNIRLVQWATRATLWQVLEHGVRVWSQPAPFDHTKLLIVDDCWVFLGSANWDVRSLRLNFELNLEVYDEGLAAATSVVFAEKLGRSRPITLPEVDGRPLPERIRDGFARLFSPLL